MIISYRWLLEYLPEPLPVNELSKILTSIGLEVEAVETVESIPGGLRGLVIGEVLTCVKHPNADKLSVTTVSAGGDEVLHIVCGAQCSGGAKSDRSTRRRYRTPNGRHAIPDQKGQNTGRRK